MTMEHLQIGQSEIPLQTQGSKMDTVEQIQCNSTVQAEQLYNLLRQRLLDINNWGVMAKLPLSSFKLFNATGRAADRQAQEGDFIRIDIPGPGTKTGKGYDWVIVESITEQQDADYAVSSLRVRPCPHPLNPDESIAHFLGPQATSTFHVKLSGNTISAEEHGRNEMVNIYTNHVLDNIRNAIVGLCAKVGFAYPQWKSLVTGMLEMQP